jgi:cytochrome b
MVMWALAALINPAFTGSPAHLALGLAVVALLVVVALALPMLPPTTAPGLRAFARRARTAARPRLLDPDAAGRPRPRAPTGCPATA